jgi:regulator of protease activity HflC (stomatin/prohibitin superfamily)
MNLFKKQYQVKPNMVGYLYRNHVFEQKLEPGYYSFWDWNNRTDLYCLSVVSRLMVIINQEILSQDNIAFRYSFTIIYKIIDGQKLLSQFTLDKPIGVIIAELEQRIGNIVQTFVRKKISEMNSEELNEKRAELHDFKTKEMEEQASAFGIVIEEAQLRDLTFPKHIQDLFAKQLEAKIRAKSDIENARTAVATARTLKNAAELMKNDENIKFIQFLETITKIAEKGKHTFNIGDINPINKQ